MPTTYRSILQAQPADGDVVFIRRFTRDPPILAAWIAPLRLFLTTSSFQIHIEGSTLAGNHAATFQANLLGSGKPGWLATSGTTNIYFLPQPYGPMTFGALSIASTGFFAPDTIWPGGIPICTTFTATGANPFGLPSSMSFEGTTLAALTLPANLVSAWRPQ